MTDIFLPPMEAVVDLHGEWIAAFGGAAGLRDRGGLESALARAQQIIAYEPDAGVAALATAVCAGICRNHPFVDGNKRAAFGTLGVILGMNGLYLDVAESEATRVVVALAAGEMAEAEFRGWVAGHVNPDQE